MIFTRVKVVDEKTSLQIDVCLADGITQSRIFGVCRYALDVVLIGGSWRYDATCLCVSVPASVNVRVLVGDRKCDAM